MVPDHPDAHHHKDLLPSMSSHQSTYKSRRRETFALATLIIVLLVISIATTITLLVIIYRLRLVPGFEFFTILDDGQYVILNKNTYVDRILLAKNRISGLSTITGNVVLESGRSSLRISRDGIRAQAQHRFEIRSGDGQRLLFPFDWSQIPLTSNVKTLSVPNGIRDVKLIRSPLDEDLTIKSKGRIRIRGNEGVIVEGKQIRIDSREIFLSSANSSVTVDGYRGVYLNMDRFENFRNVTGGGEQQYKLCICGRNGRLFQIRSASCADARFPQSDNPCL